MRVILGLYLALILLAGHIRGVHANRNRASQRDPVLHLRRRRPDDGRQRPVHPRRRIGHRAVDRDGAHRRLQLLAFPRS